VPAIELGQPFNRRSGLVSIGESERSDTNADKAVGPSADKRVGQLPCSRATVSPLECRAMEASNGIVLERVRMIQRLRDSSPMESGFELEDILAQSAWEPRSPVTNESRVQNTVSLRVSQVWSESCFGSPFGNYSQRVLDRSWVGRAHVPKGNARNSIDNSKSA
jgi:hypothetical protein